MRNIPISLHGTTARVLPFRPNWGSSVNEIIEYRTDVMTAKSGREQRRALREIPRRGFEFEVHLKGEEARLYDAMMREWMDRWFAVPVWPDQTRLTVDAPAASFTEIICPIDNRSFEMGQYAILYADSNNYEVVEIAALTSLGLVLTEPLQRDWPAGTEVYPLVLGHLNNSVTMRRVTDQLQLGTISLTGSGNITPSGLPDLPAPNAYDGYELITHIPNWRNDIQFDFNRDFRTLDLGFGPVAYYRKRDFTPTVRQFEWFLKTRADVWAFKGFVARMQGQFKQAWVPTGMEDLVIAQTYAPNNAQIVVGGTAQIDLLGLNTSYDRIRLISPTGTTYNRRITAMTANGDNTSIQLDTALGEKPSPNTGWRVMYLIPSRLAVDRVVIPWVTTDTAIPTTSFRSIKL